MLTTQQQERSVLDTTPYDRAFHLAQQDGSVSVCIYYCPVCTLIIPLRKRS